MRRHEVEGYVGGDASEPDFEVKSICQSIGEGYISTEEAKAYVRKAFAQGYLAREAPRQAADSELDKEIVRWQKAIYELCKKAVGVDGDYIIDGGGCDSGDPLDFTLTEIGQAFAYFRESRQPLSSDSFDSIEQLCERSCSEDADLEPEEALMQIWLIVRGLKPSSGTVQVNRKMLEALKAIVELRGSSITSAIYAQCEAAISQAESCRYCKAGDPREVRNDKWQHYIIGDSPTWVDCKSKTKGNLNG